MGTNGNISMSAGCRRYAEDGSRRKLDDNAIVIEDDLATERRVESPGAEDRTETTCTVSVIDVR